MQRLKISRLLKSAEDGQSVTIAGWLRSKRLAKKFAFLVLNDGSTGTDLQVIVDQNIDGFQKLNELGTGACVRIDGRTVASPGKGQKWEVHADSLEVVGSSSNQYPLQKKGHSLEFLREIGHLRARTATFGAVFRIRNYLAMEVHNFFQNRGFQWAHAPILTASDCEGAGELFTVTTFDLDKKLPRDAEGRINYSEDFFGKRAHLTVSGQLNGESLALCQGDIYTFGPTFRAENSNTTRHLAEFWMVEPEMAFASLRDNAILAEEFLRHMCANVVANCGDDLEFLAKHYEDCDPQMLQQIADSNFESISYTHAIEVLRPHNQKFEHPAGWGSDLQTEHERFLTETIYNKPLIITDYPAEIKAFYMKSNPDNKTVAAMDVLMPRIGEIIGGSAREDNLDLLVAKLAASGIPQQEMEWYLDLRRFGGCPHAGFGLGFERLVQYVTGMSNIRDVIPFPRVPGSIRF